MDKPLDKAIRIVGSATKLATVLGVTKSAVGQWGEEGRRVPAEHCPGIEHATGHQVLCEELRPDIDWLVVRARLRPSADAARDSAGAKLECVGGGASGDGE
ncbi:helix-turn-helix domain-containing protein [Pandoraea sp. SD6-2]|uniref:transcriptional regulator n=1 Tax=Pandoraea sp. SD6-2 TaxID=1286093 RepID=UPI00032DC740|nr:helix-turn-helix domain-containing protein [Pandoraea sp. SD6-2]EON11935.1 utative DNA-binding transcriptional regulator [Pandoraea sp. SD6-2]